MTDVLRGVSTRATPQKEPTARATVRNDAGGYGFEVDDMVRARRFLVLGVTGGTFYVRDYELAKDNADVILRLAKTQPQALVDLIVEISVGGYAPKVNQAIFALAAVAGEADEAGRAYALSKLSAVCRTSTHMYLFAEYVQQFRGWGPGLRKAVARWYGSRDTDKLAYQILKYRQREGWRHADLLALSHPRPVEPVRDNLYRYIVDTMRKRDDEQMKRASGHREAYQSWGADEMPALVAAYEEAQTAPVNRIIELIGQHGLAWEMLPDTMVTNAKVWEAMLDKGVPIGALIRQLPRLTNLGLTTGQTGRAIAAQLTDPEQLKRGRVHPITVLVAERTYASGVSARGEGRWSPTPDIIDALHDGFHLSYGGVNPANKITLVACDTSGSMTWNAAGGLPLQALEVAGALALVMANTEPSVVQVGFNTSAWGMTISKRQRLDDVLSYMRHQPNGGTDCALPMLWALETRTYVETFVTITDEQTWAGRIHPYQALIRYREQMNPNARLVVVATTPRRHTIADPEDAGTWGVEGFDSNMPQLISDFSAGRI